MKHIGTDPNAVTATDLTPVRQDILTLALKQGIAENHTKFNLPNSAICKFEADADFDLDGSTTISRNDSEYIWASIPGLGDQTLIDRTAGTAISGIDGSGEYTAFGGIAAVFDGNISQAVASCAKENGSYTNYSWLGKDWGSGVTKIVNGFKWQSSTDDGANAVSSNTSGGKLELFGSATNDTTEAVNLGGLSSLNMKLLDNDYSLLTGLDETTAYRYHWVRQYVVNAGNGICGELRFYEDEEIYVINATGTALGTTNVPTSAVTDVSGVMLLKNDEGTATLGTDVKAYFTADNSNWTEADSYTDAGTFSTGIKMIKLGKTTCTSGSDVRWKIVWANQSDGSLETLIYGIGLNY